MARPRSVRVSAAAARFIPVAFDDSTTQLAPPSELPIVCSFTARAMYPAVRLLAGERPPTPLLNEMVRAAWTSFLLVAAGENDQEVASNEIFTQALGGQAELWVAPGVAHTGAYSRHPDEYERRLLAFLDSRLLE